MRCTLLAWLATLLTAAAGMALPTWAVLPTGVIDTIVGGANGDGLPAAVAKIGPKGMDFDASGNLYLADGAGNRIRRIDAITNIITTIAGNGTAGFSGDGGPATTSTLNSPSGITVDSAGNIYFSDERNHRVRRIDGHSGLITTIAGNGTATYNGDGIAATTASLYYPEGLAFLPDGSVLIADSAHLRIRKVSPNGTISTVAGTGSSFGSVGDGGPATSAVLANPADVDTDVRGNVYIADAGICRIRRVDASTQIITTIAGGAGNSATVCSYNGDNGAAIAANLNNPAHIALTTRHLYIAEQSRVRDLDLTTGIITTVAGTGTAGYSGDGGPATLATLNNVTGLLADDLGTLRIADSGARNVRLVNAARMIDTVVGGTNGDGLPAEEATLAPQGIKWDRYGNLYVVDTTGNCIRRVDAATNIITTIAGNGSAGFSGDNGPAIAATLNSPTAIVVDGVGNVFVSDERNHRVRRIDGRSGVITTFAGNGTTAYNGDSILATAASLYYPEGLALLPDGSVLIADSAHLRVRKVGPNGSITTVAGTGSSFGSIGDGGPATSAVLVFPVDVTLDLSSNLYITDASACRIRRVDAISGTITTVAGGAGAGSSICSYRGDGGLATAASLNGPARAAVDSSGVVYIAEPQAPRVRAVDPATGIISTVAGTGVSSYSGDGGDPARATFVYLGGLLLDASNTLFISDAGGGNVRRIQWLQTAATPTLTFTAIPTSTQSRTPTRTATQAPPFTSTPAATLTSTSVFTSTPTPTRTSTPLPTSPPTNSPTRTPTPLPTNSPTNSPTRTSTPLPTSPPTSTPTNSPTRTSTPLPTNSLTSSPTSSPTRTPTSTPALPTATPIVGVAGRVLYYGNNAPVGGATLQITTPLLTPVAQTQSDSAGQYSMSGLGAATLRLQAQKAGDFSAGISAFDAVYVLEALSGSRTLSPAQLLACDVTGNGSLSALDASVILQYKSGLISAFPVAQTCASDWAFLPTPQSLSTIQVIPPQILPGSCQPGTVNFNPLAGLATGIDFSAVLFGDCTGNWLPSSGSVAALSTTSVRGLDTASPVRLGRVRRHGRRVGMPLYVQTDGGFQGLDVQVTYDPTVLYAVRVRRIGATQNALMAANTTVPGRINISLASAARLPAGEVLSLEFSTRQARVATGSIHVTHVAVE